ncbi:hypothetical protein K503DRAFT_860083 [Rhizopogon vinicolor AM-OR11-026]|uniref:Uncharacterized protein n=1 Tax=Rhizopogon vinicolor AM-OR11-026 TaxID=1314800 RepID=A0A1B7MJW7_9AGAM|nr:hypothetical protein K503DRAFT_860083 [Rhizopogon vinicolor AM-OR11-026]
MPTGFRSGRDLIIPSPEAFCHPGVTASSPEFPQFTARNCSWSSTFEMVKQPRLLWACWHPSNLGEYHSIEQIWTAWHEGTIFDGLIEHKWGGMKDHSTNKGHRQTWRPHNDNNVRRKWFQFMFCITDQVRDRYRQSRI